MISKRNRQARRHAGGQTNKKTDSQAGRHNISALTVVGRHHKHNRQTHARHTPRHSQATSASKKNEKHPRGMCTHVVGYMVHVVGYMVHVVGYMSWGTCRGYTLICRGEHVDHDI